MAMGRSKRRQRAKDLQVATVSMAEKPVNNPKTCSAGRDCSVGLTEVMYYSSSCGKRATEVLEGE